jgi:uncharacterized membrane protein YdbT with pleckstrin-like domain
VTATGAAGRGNSGSRYLLPGEHVVRQTRRHIAMLVRPSAETLVGVVAATALGTRLGDTVLGPVLWLAVLALYARLFWKIGSWFVERLYLTDRRLFLASGLLTRKVAAMPVVKLTDITFERSLAGRLFGYGKLIVESAGEHQALERIEFIPSPEDFYQAVSRVVFRIRRYPVEDLEP